MAGRANLSTTARLRLEWMIFYYKEAKESASKTTGYFGITRKTFYKWLNRFKESKYDVKSMENQSRRPHRLRKWEVTLLQETRVIKLTVAATKF